MKGKNADIAIRLQAKKDLVNPNDLDCSRMKTYSVFNAIPLSLYSMEFYRDVARNWKGVGALFLLLTVPITALSTGVILFNLYFTQVGPLQAASRNIPDIEVRNGQLVSPVESVVIEYDGSKVLVIDPSGKYGPSTEGQFVMTKSDFRFRGGARPVKLSLFRQNWSLKGAQFVPVLKQILLSTIAVMVLICLILEGPARLLGTAAAAIIGKVFRSPRKFSEIMRLLLAITVPLSILSLPIQCACIFVKGLPFNLSNHLCTLIWAGYIIVVFRSTRVTANEIRK